MAIIPIWQPLGYSTNQIAKKIGEKHETRGTHTGTLDPMAEGVIVVLTEEDRFKKYDLAGWKKGYEFEILLGLKTDSYDALGLILEEKRPKVDLTKVSEVLRNFVGDYNQEVPAYSAIGHKGRKLFEYAKQGIEIDPLPQKRGKIYKIELLEYQMVPKIVAVEQILKKLKAIVGDFRQQDIISQWENYRAEISKESSQEVFPVIKVFVETSRGLYVRSLSQDISRKLKEVGFVFSLARVKNGEFTKEDCRNLEDIFGPGYDMLFRSAYNKHN